MSLFAVCNSDADSSSALGQMKEWLCLPSRAWLFTYGSESYLVMNRLEQGWEGFEREGAAESRHLSQNWGFNFPICSEFIPQWFIEIAYRLGCSVRRCKFTMSPVEQHRFIRFLQDELLLSSSSIAVALKHRDRDPGPLAMILWQYGLVTLEQLDRIFDWLEESVAWGADSI